MRETIERFASKETRDIKPGFKIGPFWSTPVKNGKERRKRYRTVQSPVASTSTKIEKITYKEASKNKSRYTAT